MTNDPAHQTVTLRLSGREFSTLLHEAHGNPETEDWKVPTLRKAIEAGEFDQIEVFADTLLGPIIGLHCRSQDVVEATVRRPIEGIYRAVADMVRDARSTD